MLPISLLMDDLSTLNWNKKLKRDIFTDKFKNYETFYCLDPKDHKDASKWPTTSSYIFIFFDRIDRGLRGSYSDFLSFIIFLVIPSSWNISVN